MVCSFLLSFGRAMWTSFGFGIESCLGLVEEGQWYTVLTIFSKTVYFCPNVVLTLLVGLCGLEWALCFRLKCALFWLVLFLF